MMQQAGISDAAIERVIFDEAAIAAAIRRMSAEIARDYAGQPLLLLGVLKGAMLFCADLGRALTRHEVGPDVTLDFIAVTSYGGGTKSSGEVRLLKDASEPLEGRHVLIVEDIVDNGLTLRYLRTLLESRRPASVRAAALLDKPYNRIADVAAEYIGMVCPDEFVVGYGLDYQERYRTLPFVAKLRPSITGS
jgi:hypoxanthine phosphoribosyltransferase